MSYLCDQFFIFSPIFIIINPLQASVAFLYPLKTSENISFLMFSEGIEKQHRPVMG